MEKFLVTEWENDMEIAPLSKEEEVLILPIIAKIALDKYKGVGFTDANSIYGHLPGWEEFVMFIPECGLEVVQSIKVFTLTETLLA